jgi:hypothetical protein
MAALNTELAVGPAHDREREPKPREVSPGRAEFEQSHP